MKQEEILNQGNLATVTIIEVPKPTYIVEVSINGGVHCGICGAKSPPLGDQSGQISGQFFEHNSGLGPRVVVQ